MTEDQHREQVDVATIRAAVETLDARAEQMRKPDLEVDAMWLGGYEQAALDLLGLLPPVPYVCRHDIACGPRHSVGCIHANLRARLARPTGA